MTHALPSLSPLPQLAPRPAGEALHILEHCALRHGPQVMPSRPLLQEHLLKENPKAQVTVSVKPPRTVRPFAAAVLSRDHTVYRASQGPVVSVVVPTAATPTAFTPHCPASSVHSSFTLILRQQYGLVRCPINSPNHFSLNMTADLLCY